MDRIIRHLGLSDEAEKIINDIYSKYGETEEFIALSKDLREGKTLEQEYFEKGGKAGEARGVLFFDGENIFKEKGIELKGLI